MINVHIIDNTGQIKPGPLTDNISVSQQLGVAHTLNAIEKEQPSVILLNYAVHKDQTTDYIKLILSISPESKIVLIADELELSEEKIVSCLIAGAKGYQNAQQLETYANKLITVVDAGEAWITRRMVTTLLDSLRMN